MSKVFTKELRVREAAMVHTSNSRFSDNGTTLDIPLSEVNVEVLEKVIEFCEHYLTEPMTEIERPLKSATKMEDFVQKWYADFVDEKQDLLFGLIMAAESIGIEPLFDLTCLALDNYLIEGKMSEEITAVFVNLPTHQEDG